VILGYTNGVVIPSTKYKKRTLESEKLLSGSMAANWSSSREGPMGWYGKMKDMKDDVLREWSAQWKWWPLSSGCLKQGTTLFILWKLLVTMPLVQTMRPKENFNRTVQRYNGLPHKVVELPVT
jgi:hypothetical protein